MEKKLNINKTMLRSKYRSSWEPSGIKVNIVSIVNTIDWIHSLNKMQTYQAQFIL